MAYRLKRKRFNCKDCDREWNQLVGAEIDSVKCKSPSVTPPGDVCNGSALCLNHDVPTQKFELPFTKTATIASQKQQQEEAKENARNTYYNTMNTPGNRNAAPRRELREGAYRMVFSDKKNPEASQAQTINPHNKLNLRDRSTEPHNLFGDANIRRREPERRNQPNNSDSDEPPDLEEAWQTSN